MPALSAYVVSLTPFDAAGELDIHGLRGHLQRMRAAGLGVYLGGGGSGEGYVLTPGERRRLLEVAVEELKGHVPVRWMGVEPRQAREMVDQLALAEEAGVDAAQVYPLDMGHGTCPTDHELSAYLREVVAATDLPVVLSTHEAVGYLVPVPLLAELAAEHENVIGVNCTTSDPRYLIELTRTLADRLEIHVGGPVHALTNFALGGHGFLVSEANLAPRLCAAVTMYADGSEWSRAMLKHAQLLRLFSWTVRYPSIVAVKAVLSELGWPGGVPRPPRQPLGPECHDEVKAIIDDFDLLATEG